MVKSKNSPKFISNSAVGEDLLSGKAHERIADTIQRLILNKNSETKIIGLDGPWGSGKSTVIKLIESKLATTHHVFVHDAWGHQEDLNRRAFLEGLVSSLVEQQQLEEEIWNEKLEYLLAKRSKTKTSTVPKLSNGIIATLLITVFTPITASLADNTIDPFFKLLLSTLPLIIGLIVLLVYCLVHWKKVNLADLFYIYKEKELIDVTDLIISEKEPSVREFRNWMTELSIAMKSKELIIVFDNMDRLPKDKVQILWSSIHTFFADQSFDRVWTIVPFDRTHIKEAFNDEMKHLSQFINKTFNIVFTISPPVLTDWHLFFEDKFKEAFNDDEEDEMDTVKELYDISNNTITPRNIVAFINELVAVKTICVDKIDLRYIALFVLNREIITSDPLSQILSLEFAASYNKIFENDQQLPDVTASLVYNVPLNLASQVTLTREIEISIREVNSEKLQGLVKHPQFLKILQQVVNKLKEVEGAAEVINSIVLSDDESKLGKQLQTIWNKIADIQLKTHITNQQLTNNHITILRKSPNRRNRLTEYFIKSLKVSEEFDGKSYFLGMEMIEKEIHALSIDIKIEDQIESLEVEMPAFNSYLSEARGNYKKYKLQANTQALNEYYSGLLSDTNLDYLQYIKSDYLLGPLLTELEKLLVGDDLKLEEYANLINNYKILTPKKPFKVLIDDIVLETLLGLSEKNNSVYFELVSARLAMGSDILSTTDLFNQVEPTLVTNIASRIEYYADYGALLKKLISEPNPLFVEVIKHLLSNSYGVRTMSIIAALPDLVELTKVTGLMLEEIIFNFNGWLKYAKENINIENIQKVIVDPELFGELSTMNIELGKYLVEVLNNSLKLISIDEWVVVLTDETSYNYRAIKSLLNAGSFSLPDNLLQSYKSVLVNVAKGITSIPTDSQLWNNLYYKANKTSLRPTIKNIRDLFISDISITPDLFKFFGEMLLRQGEPNRRPGDFTRRILTSVANDLESLILINNYQDLITPVVLKANEDALDLKLIIKEKINAGNGIFVDLAKSLSIDLIDNSELDL